MDIDIRTDYDFKDKRVLAHVLNGIIVMHKTKLKKILVRRSSGSHFHVIYSIWLPDEFKEMDKFSLILGLRLGFADDTGRCLHDILRKKVNLSIDKLFYRKGILKDGKIQANSVNNWVVIYDGMDKNNRMAKPRRKVTQTEIENKIPDA